MAGDIRPLVLVATAILSLMVEGSVEDVERLQSDLRHGITLNYLDRWAEGAQLLDRTIPELPVDGISSLDALVAYSSCRPRWGRPL